KPLTGTEVVIDLPEDPRTTLGRTTNHDGIRACGSQDVKCLLRRINISVGNNWNGSSRLDLGDRVVFGLAVVHHLSSPPVDRDHCCARAFRDARNSGGILIGLIPSGSD